MRSVELRNEKLLIKFFVKREEFKDILSTVRNLEGAWFSHSEKAWVANATKNNFEVLKYYHFKPSGEVRERFDPEERVEIPPTPFEPVPHERLPKGLRPYQIKGVEFLEATKGRGILSFFMRGGKSITALSWVFLHKDKLPLLIVCPATAKIGWQREIKKWSDYESLIIYGKTPYDLPKDIPIYIINYELLFDWKETIKKHKIETIIVDECQYVSNKFYKKKERVKRTSAFVFLAKKIKHIIPLSGTPFTTCPAQFYTVLNVIRPDLFSNRHEYLDTFCDPEYTYFGLEYKGVSNLRKLRSLLALCMIRYRKEDVLDDLPEEQHIIVPLEVDKKVYAKEAREYEEWLSHNIEASEEEIGRRVNLIKSISYSEKRPQILEWIRNFIENQSKLVIFCYHRDVCEDLHNSFKDTSVLLYGGMTAQKKQNAIDSFQNDAKISIFIGQVDSASTAISLSVSDTVAFVEMPLTAGSLKQARERIFLPGDGKKSLAFYYIVMGGTVDEDRAVALQERSKIIDKVLDGEVQELFGSDIKHTFRKRK